MKAGGYAQRKCDSGPERAACRLNGHRPLSLVEAWPVAFSGRCGHCRCRHECKLTKCKLTIGQGSERHERKASPQPGRLAKEALSNYFPSRRRAPVVASGAASPAALVVLAALGAPSAAWAGCIGKNQTISSPSTPGPIFGKGGNTTIDAGGERRRGPDRRLRQELRDRRADEQRRDRRRGGQQSKNRALGY